MSLFKKYSKQFAATALTIGAIVSTQADVNATPISVGPTIKDSVGSGKVIDPATASAKYANIEQMLSILEQYATLTVSAIDGIDVSETKAYISAADKKTYDDAMATKATGDNLFAQLTDIQTKLSALLTFDGQDGSLATTEIKAGAQETYQTAVGALITEIKAAYNMLTDGNIIISYTEDADDIENGDNYVTLEQYNTLKSEIEKALKVLVLAHATHYDTDGDTNIGADKAFADLISLTASAPNDATGDGDAFKKLFGDALSIDGTDTTHKTLKEINIAIDGTDNDATDGNAGIKNAYLANVPGDAYMTTSKSDGDGAILLEQAKIAFELQKGKAALGLDPAAALPAVDVTDLDPVTGPFKNAGKTFLVTNPSDYTSVANIKGGKVELVPTATFDATKSIYAPMVIADDASSDTVGQVNHDNDDGTTELKQLNYVTLSEANATLAELRVLEAKLLDYDGLDDTEPYKANDSDGALTVANPLTLYTTESITNEINDTTLDNLEGINDSITDVMEAFEEKQKVGTGANKESRANRIVELLDYIDFATFAKADGSEIGGLSNGAWATGVSTMAFEPDIDLEDMEDYGKDDAFDASATDFVTAIKKPVSLLYGIDIDKDATGAKNWVTPAVNDELYKAAKEARKQYELYTGKEYLAAGAGTADSAKYVSEEESKAQTLEMLEDAVNNLTEAIEDYKAEEGFAGTQGDFNTEVAKLFGDGSPLSTAAIDVARTLVVSAGADGVVTGAFESTKTDHHVSEYGIVYGDAATAFVAEEKWAKQADVNTFNDVILAAEKIKTAVELFKTAGKATVSDDKKAYSIPEEGDVITLDSVDKTVTAEHITLIKEIISKFGDEDGEYDDQDYFKHEAKKVTDAQKTFNKHIYAENYTKLFAEGGAGAEPGHIPALKAAIGAEGDGGPTPASGARGLLTKGTTFGQTTTASGIYISEDGYLYGDDSATADTLIPVSDDVDGNTTIEPTEQHKWVPLADVTAFDTVIKDAEAKHTLFDGLKTKAESALTSEDKAALAEIIKAEDDFELDDKYFENLLKVLESATETFEDATTETTDTSDALHTEYTALTAVLNPKILEHLANNGEEDPIPPTLLDPSKPAPGGKSTNKVAISNNGFTNEDGSAFATTPPDAITHYVTRANFDTFANAIKAAIALRDATPAEQAAQHKADTAYLTTAKTTLDAAITLYESTDTMKVTADHKAAFEEAYATFWKSDKTGALGAARAKLGTDGIPVASTNIVSSENGLTHIVTTTDGDGKEVKTVTAIAAPITYYVTQATIDAFQTVLKPADEIQIAVELFKTAATAPADKAAYAIPKVGDALLINGATAGSETTVTQAHIDKINEILNGFAADATWFATTNKAVETATTAYDAAKIAENMTALTAQLTPAAGTFAKAIDDARLVLDADTSSGLTVGGGDVYISEDGITYVKTVTETVDGKEVTTTTTELIPADKKYVTPAVAATFERAIATAEKLETTLGDVTTLTDKRILDALIKDDGTLDAEYFTKAVTGVTTKVTDAQAVFVAAQQEATGGAFTEAYDAFALAIKTAIGDKLVGAKVDGTAPAPGSADKPLIEDADGKLLATVLPKDIFVSDNGIGVIAGTFVENAKYVTEDEFEDLTDAIQDTIDIRDKDLEDLVKSYKYNPDYFTNFETKLATAVSEYETAATKVEKKTAFEDAVEAAFGARTAPAPNISAKLTNGITYTYMAAKSDADSYVTLVLGGIVISEDGFTKYDVTTGKPTADSVGNTDKWITPEMHDDLADAILELEDIREAALYVIPTDPATAIEALVDQQEDVIDDYLAALGGSGGSGSGGSGISNYFSTLITGTASNPTALESAIKDCVPAQSNTAALAALKAQLTELLNGGLKTTATDNNGDDDMTDEGEAVESVLDEAWDAVILRDKFKLGLASDTALAVEADKKSRVSDLKGIDTLTFARLETLTGNELTNAATGTAPGDITSLADVDKAFYKYVTTATLTNLETAIKTATDYQTKLDDTTSAEATSATIIEDITAQITALEAAMTKFNTAVVDLSVEANKNSRQWLYEKLVEAQNKKFTLAADGTTKVAVVPSNLGGVDIEAGVSWVKTAIFDWYNDQIDLALKKVKDLKADDSGDPLTESEITIANLNASVTAMTNAIKSFVPVVSSGNEEYTKAKADAFAALNTILVEMGYNALSAELDLSDNEAGDGNATEITDKDVDKALTEVTDLTIAAVLYRPSEKFGLEVPTTKTWIPKKNFDDASAKLKTWAKGMIGATTNIASFDWYTAEIGKWDTWFKSLVETNHGTQYDASVNPEKSFQYLIDEIKKYGSIIDGTTPTLVTPAWTKPTTDMPKIVGTTDTTIKEDNQKDTLLDYYWGDVSMDWDNGSFTAPGNFWAKKAEITPILNVYNNTIQWWLNPDNFKIDSTDASKSVINNTYAQVKASYDIIKTTFENFYGKDVAGAQAVDADGADITPKLYKGTDGSEHISITASIAEANDFMGTLNYAHSAIIPTTTYTLADGTPNQTYESDDYSSVYVSGLADGSDVPAGSIWYTQTEINNYVKAISTAQAWLDYFERSPLTVKTVDMDKHEKVLTDMTATLEAVTRTSNASTAHADALEALNEAITQAYFLIDTDEPENTRAISDGQIRVSYNGEGGEVPNNERWVTLANYNWYKDTVIKAAETGRDKKGTTATTAHITITLNTLKANTTKFENGAKPGTENVFGVAQRDLVDAIEAVDARLAGVKPSYYNGTDVDGDWVPAKTYTWLKGLNDKAIANYDYSANSESLELEVSVSNADKIAAEKKTIKKSDLEAQTKTLTTSLETFEKLVKESDADYDDAADKEALRVALDKFKNNLNSIVYSKNQNGTDISQNYAWVTNAQVALTVGGTQQPADYIKTTLQKGYDTAIKEYWKKPTDETANFSAAKVELGKYQDVLNTILNGDLTVDSKIVGSNVGSFEAVATAREGLVEAWLDALDALKGVHTLSDADAGKTGDDLKEAIAHILDGQYYASQSAVDAINTAIANTKTLYNQKATTTEVKAATKADLDAQTTALNDAITAFNTAKVEVKRVISASTGSGDKTRSIEVITLSMGDGSEIIFEQEILTPVAPTTPEIMLPTIELPIIDYSDDFLMEEEIFEELLPDLEVPEIEIPEIEVPEIEIPEIEIPALDDEEYPVMAIPELGEQDTPVIEIPEEFVDESYEAVTFEEFFEEYYEDEEYVEDYYIEEEYYEEVIEEEYIEEVFEEIYEEIEIEEIEEIEFEEISIEEIEIDEIEVEEIIIEEVSTKKSIFAKLFGKLFKS